MRVTQALIRNLQQKPKAIATIDGDRHRTWEELVERISKLASGLRKSGLQTQDRVAIVSLNSDRYLEVLFATPWAGGVIVPINYRWSAPEIAFALNDSGTKTIFLDDAFGGLAGDLRKLVEHELTIIALEDEFSGSDAEYERLIAGSDGIPEFLNAGDDISGIFYTGGTTGRSKGVMLTHENHMSNTFQSAAIMETSDEMNYLHAAPAFHIADACFFYTMTQLAGCHIFIPRFEPQACAEAIEKHAISDIILVPTMIQMLLSLPDFSAYDFSSLKHLYYGASPMPEAVASELVEKLSHVKAYHLYGQTEAAPLLTALDSTYHVTTGEMAGRLRSAGRAMPAVEIKIIDENGDEVPRGTIGEIIARGPNIMKGYWGQEKLTKDTIKNNWLHTGDAAHMDKEGFIFISDRLKDMIISGGENVYSAEVENAMYQHPKIAQCAVIGVPDEKWGERVHAIVLTENNDKVSQEELMSHCRELIADFKCPRSITFRTEPFPLSGAGKVLKTELRKPFWEGRNKAVN
jgi:long-chain acyl-CoA synthetase